MKTMKTMKTKLTYLIVGIIITILTISAGWYFPNAYVDYKLLFDQTFSNGYIAGRSDQVMMDRVEFRKQMIKVSETVKNNFVPKTNTSTP